MYSVPSPEDVAEVALSLGIHLSTDEARLYQQRLIQDLEAIDQFLQSRVDESKPTLIAPRRDPGHRPPEQDDPHRAWLWRCRISSGKSGVLEGKTVSFKDNIAVAGMPLTFNVFALDNGFQHP